MKRPTWLFCALLGGIGLQSSAAQIGLQSASARPAQQSAAALPEDFAFGAPITVPPGAPAYRLPLPLALYGSATRADLGDIRVFNARGEVVPYSLQRKAQTPIHSAAVSLPLFALPTGARVVVDGVRVTIHSPGSAVDLQTRSAPGAAVSIGQYILDARGLDVAIARLQFVWPESDLAYSGLMRIEASDDLDSWRTVVAQSVIANLRSDVHAIIQNSVAMPPVKAKFWRTSWLGTPPVFKLLAVLAEPADAPQALPRASVDVAGAQDPKSPRDVLFDLGAAVPVDRVNLLLPQTNTVVNVELSSRQRALDPWRPVTTGTFYRLSAVGSEHPNALHEIGADRDRFWRARLPAESTASGVPRLHVEWIPDELTFLARGPGPYVLAYGSASAGRAETDLSQIPSNIDIQSAAAGRPYRLGGPARLVPQAAPIAKTRFALWAVLSLAVVGLAGMAYQLATQGTTGATDA